MPDRHPEEKLAKAADTFLRFLLRSKKTGEVIGSPQERKACDILVEEELRRSLKDRRQHPIPPRALRVAGGFWIVYRRSQNSPALTIGTGPDETIARALINRIEAEGDIILTGKACPLCGVWVDAIDENSRDATLKILEIDALLISQSSSVLGCCLDCWGQAHDRVKDELTTRHGEWMEQERMREAERETKFHRYRRAGRKVRHFLLRDARR